MKTDALCYIIKYVNQIQKWNAPSLISSFVLWFSMDKIDSLGCDGHIFFPKDSVQFNPTCIVVIIIVDGLRRSKGSAEWPLWHSGSPGRFGYQKASLQGKIFTWCGGWIVLFFIYFYFYCVCVICTHTCTCTDVQTLYTCSYTQVSWFYICILAI